MTAHSDIFNVTTASIIFNEVAERYVISLGYDGAALEVNLEMTNKSGKYLTS